MLCAIVYVKLDVRSPFTVTYEIEEESTMGTYFHGNSEIQGDGSQTLILMNSGYNHNLGGYSDSTNHQPPPLSNFFFLNSANSNATTNLAHTSNTDQSTQHFVGIPLSASQEDQSHRPSIVHSQQHEISTLHSFVPPMHHYGLYNQLDLTAAREATPSNQQQQQQQGLSLSLSSQHPGFGPFRTEDSELPSPAPAISPKSTNNVQVAQASLSVVSMNGVQSVLLNSKYLKVAQELLYEVANVGKGLQNIDQLGKPSTGNSKTIKGGSAGGEGLSGEGQTSSKRSVELTTVERQEVQMKKAKLVNMLDEVSILATLLSLIFGEAY